MNEGSASEDEDRTPPSVDEILRSAGLDSLGEDPPIEAILAVMERFRDLVAGTDGLTREVLRQAAIDRLGGKVTAPARLVDAALADGDSRPEEPGEDEGSHQTFGGGIVDVVRVGDELAWLVVRDGKVEVLDQVEGRSPWPRRALPWPGIPRAEQVMAHVVSDPNPPFWELVRVFGERVILPDPPKAWAVVLAAWTLGTYLLDRFAYFPLLLFEGPPERGKTRAGKAILFTSFRGMYTPSPSPATIFRDRARHRLGILLDVGDLPGLMLRSGDIADLLLNSFERDGVIRRCTRPDAPPPDQVETFAAYGPTILATNRALPEDSALASRCIRVPMPEAGGIVIPDAMRPEHAIDIRAQAIAWAALMEASGATLPEVDPPFRGRLRDLSLPLLRVLSLACPAALPLAEGVLAGVDRARRTETSVSPEARVARALYELRGEVKNGRLFVHVIREYINKGLPETDQLDSQAIGRARKGLGLSGGYGGQQRHAYLVWPGETRARALHDRYAAPDRLSAEEEQV